MFDAVKGIAIYLVIIGHLLPPEEKGVAAFIAACHMPVFFFVSGYFFQKSYEKYSGKDFLKRKIFSLVIPYLCWSFVSFFMNGTLLILNGNIGEIGKEFLNVFLYARSVWFLIVLFGAEILYFVIRKCADKLHINQFILCALAESILVFWIQMSGGAILCGYKLGWLFPYFLFGDIWYRFFRTKFNAERKYNILAFLILLLSYTLMLYCFCKGRPYSTYFEYFQLESVYIIYYLIYYVQGFIGIGMLFALAFTLEKHGKIIVQTGYYSMDIYVLHMFFVKMFPVVSITINGNKSIWLNYILVFLYAALVAGIIVFLADKVLHKIKIYLISVGKGSKYGKRT